VPKKKSTRGPRNQRGKRLNSAVRQAFVLAIAALLTVGYTQPASASSSKRPTAIAKRAALGKWGKRVSSPRRVVASCTRVRRGRYRCAVRVAGADAAVVGSARVRIGRRSRSVSLSYRYRINPQPQPTIAFPR